MCEHRRNESDLLAIETISLLQPYRHSFSQLQHHPRSPQEPAASPRHEPPRNRPTLCTEHRPKLMRTVRSRIASLPRSVRTIRHIALKPCFAERLGAIPKEDHLLLFEAPVLVSKATQVLAETRSSPIQAAGTVQG